MNTLWNSCLVLGFVAATFGTACSSDDSDSHPPATGTSSSSSGGGGNGGGGGAGGAPSTDPFSGCTRGEVEADLVESFKPAGSGVDPQTGEIKAGNYLIATTYLAFNAEDLQKTQGLALPVIQAALGMKGLVALKLSNSASCSTARTMTLWETEEDMVALVGSPEHVNAISQLSTITRGTGNSSTWEGTEKEATWADAAKHLATETKPGI